MIKDINFAKMYVEQKIISTFQSKKSHDWDEKADDFNLRVHQSAYVNDFISRMNLDDCESVLDVGCGPGTLALPLASKLKSVFAVDFSAKMLGLVERNAKERDLDNIQTIRTSWEDNWSALPICDIAISSRSLEVLDLKEAIEKLNSKAKKRVYVTYKVGGSYVDACILEYIGKSINPKPDYFYVLAILYNMGINASVDFIDTPTGSIKYSSKKEFVNSITWSVNGLDEEQTQKAEEYYDDIIKDNPNFKPRGFKWAFISWEK